MEQKQTSNTQDVVKNKKLTIEPVKAHEYFIIEGKPNFISTEEEYKLLIETISLWNYRSNNTNLLISQKIQAQSAQILPLLNEIREKYESLIKKKIDETCLLNTVQNTQNPIILPTTPSSFNQVAHNLHQNANQNKELPTNNTKKKIQNFSAFLDEFSEGIDNFSLAESTKFLDKTGDKHKHIINNGHRFIKFFTDTKEYYLFNHDESKIIDDLIKTKAKDFMKGLKIMIEASDIEISEQKILSAIEGAFVKSDKFISDTAFLDGLSEFYNHEINMFFDHINGDILNTVMIFIKSALKLKHKYETQPMQSAYIDEEIIKQAQQLGQNLYESIGAEPEEGFDIIIDSIFVAQQNQTQEAPKTEQPQNKNVAVVKKSMTNDDITVRLIAIKEAHLTFCIEEYCNGTINTLDEYENQLRNQYNAEKEKIDFMIGQINEFDNNAMNNIEDFINSIKTALF